MQKSDWSERGQEETMTKRMTPDVVFVPGFLSREEADALLSRICSEANFQQNYIQIFGRKTVPRLEAWYAPWDYPYSKGVVLKAAPMPDYLREVIDKIAAAGFGEFNAVLINRYRDGKDYISAHSDDDYGDSQPVIPSLTLGAARPFRLAKIIGGSKLDKSTTVEYLPRHGDLLVMRGRTNAEWQHWVPKAAKQFGERINLTFRMKRSEETHHGK
jgi:alkylated DNA repair dioxygenase AlkB